MPAPYEQHSAIEKARIVQALSLFLAVLVFRQIIIDRKIVNIATDYSVDFFIGHRFHELIPFQRTATCSCVF